MSSSNIQRDDIFADSGDGIDFTEDDQTWTVDVGVLVSARFGVAIDSEFDHSTLINLGTLLTAQRTAVILGVDNALVSNAIGGQIIGAVEGVYVHGAHDIVANSGSIVGLNDFSVVLSMASSDAVLDNNGTIFGRLGGVLSSSTIGTSAIHNAGVITSNQIGIDVDTADGLTTVITNAAGGVIRSTGGVAIGAADGRVTLNNHGIISGEILLAIPDATVIREMRMVAIFPAEASDLPEMVTPADVARYPLVATQHRSNHAQLARDWMREAGLDVRPAMEIDNIGVIKRVVAVGFGTAIVPEEAITHGSEVDGLVHRPLDPPIALPLALIRRRNKADDAALRIVSDAIMSLVEPAPHSIVPEALERAVARWN